MRTELFDVLENSGLLKKSKINTHFLARASKTQLLSIAEKVSELTNIGNMHREKSRFSYAASISLGGGRSCCIGKGCREARALELAHFAALYGDKVYIHNFVGDHLRHPDAYADHEVSRFTLNGQLYVDLVILNILRPLIEAGYVIPITMPKVDCPHCLAREHFGKNADKRSRRDSHIN
jgi:hypothetical protein